MLNRDLSNEQGLYAVAMLVMLVVSLTWLGGAPVGNAAAQDDARAAAASQPSKPAG